MGFSGSLMCQSLWMSRLSLRFPGYGGSEMSLIYVHLNIGFNSDLWFLVLFFKIFVFTSSINFSEIILKGFFWGFRG